MHTLRWISLALAGAVFGSGALAQDQSQGTDPAALRRTVERLTKDLRRAEQEVAFTEESMLRLDTEIEQGIGALVDLVAKSKDSSASDGRIAVCRASAVASLRRSIALYVAEREQRRQNGWDTSRLDQRIDLRLQQMAKLAESFGPGQIPGTNMSGFDDEWIDTAVKGLKAGEYVAEIQTREEMVKELEGVVQFLTSRRDTLQLQLAVTTDPAAKSKLEREIATAEDLAEKRRAQVAELLAAPASTQAAQAGVDTASQLEKALREGRSALRVTAMDLQKLATARDYQQKRADFIRKELSAARAALEQRDTK